jgi:4-hydroxythreonine-4-phosphate dehydrogenase
MRIACTIGDCNGIGIEVWAKALLQLEHALPRSPHPVEWLLIAHPRTLMEYFEGCRCQLPVHPYLRDSELRLGSLRIEVLPCSTYAPIRWGYPDRTAAQLAAEALQVAADLARQRLVHAVVTLPISKHALHSVGWRFPGQTEFFARQYPGYEPIMLFHAPELRVALLTTHIPLRRVPGAVRADTLRSFLKRLHSALQWDFALPSPRIALLGLNPHAGENGLLGKEEQEFLLPAVHQLQQEGVQVEGPFPADAFFGWHRYRDYDAVVALYHDQGLIPFKLLAQHSGVNVTLGLPIVRTSPAHGVAYDIAGQGIADAHSMAAALQLTLELLQRRQEQDMLPTPRSRL